MADSGSDPFTMLGLERRFDLERSAIERAYLARVAAVHPDSGHLEDPGAAASALNRARASLLDPEQRANALLDLLGGPSAAEDKTLPSDFLASMMQTRLELEEAIDGGEPQAISHWHDWAQTQRLERIETVAGVFAAASSPPGGADLAALRAELNIWRYIERLIEQLPADPRGRHRSSGAS